MPVMVAMVRARRAVPFEISGLEIYLRIIIFILSNAAGLRNPFGARGS